MMEMASDLLIKLLNGNIKIDEFAQWISGDMVKNIESDVSRSEFALYVLNYIQDQTSSFLHTSSTGQPPVKNNGNNRDKKSNTTENNTENLEQLKPKVQKTLFPENKSNKIVIDKVQPGVCAEVENNLESNCVVLSPTNNIIIVTNTGNKMLEGENSLSPVKDAVLLSVNSTDSSKYSGQSCMPLQNSSQYSYSSSSTYCTPSINMSVQNSTPNSFSKCLQISSPNLVSKPLRYSTPNSVNKSFQNSPQRTPPVRLLSPNESVSPISPSYNINFPELQNKNKNQKREKRQNHMTLGDFLINQAQKTKPQEVNRKRIKPTTLISSKSNTEDLKGVNNNFGVVSRPLPSPSSPFQQSVSIVESRRNYDEERHMLKEKRNKIINESVNRGSIFLLSNKNNKKLINPNPKDVTFYKAVTRLANIYCILLDFNMIPNITAEVHFIFSLLTIQSNVVKKAIKAEGLNGANEVFEDFEVLESSCETDLYEPDTVRENKVNKDDETFAKTSEQHTDLKSVKNHLMFIEDSTFKNTDCLLKSIHNCVLFASHVIQGQIHIIQKADRITLKLLMENERLKEFAPDFVSSLSFAYQEKGMKNNCETFPETQNVISLSNETVKYEIETDNCDNFLTLKDFHNFRKQRDMFYECIHLWKNKHLQQSWNFESELKNKIFRLLTVSSDPVNMMHLVRLFCTQLISSTINKDKNENIDGMDILGLNKDKLSRLQARFVQPQAKVEPRPAPQFPDDQSFYQQFVDVACTNTLFSAHLTDCLVQRIEHLNNTRFDNEYENGSQDEIRLKLLRCITTTNLLAKFLGRVVFFPYKSSVPHPANIIETEINVRREVQPPINLVRHLQDAVQSGRLIITVPWIVEYLGMMDSVSFLLPYYKSVLQILFSIYKYVCPKMLQNRLYTVKNYENDIVSTTSELRIAIQEHFSVANGIKSSDSISQYSALLLRLCLGWLFDTSFFPENLFFSLASDSFQTTNLTYVGDKKNCLDTLELVNERIVFECCPYFAHIKLPLVTSCGTKTGTVRHITPVSAQFEKPSESLAAETLELQLEETFLSGQANSFRSTIEFIIERLASACIKQICGAVIAPSKEHFLTELEKLKLPKDTQVNHITKKTQFVEAAEIEVHRQIEATINEYCGMRIQNALFSLLGPDTLDTAVSKIGLHIASRKCHEKIIHWLHNHINTKEIFTKLMKESKSVDIFKPAPDRKVEHKDIIISPSQTLINIKETVCDIIETGGDNIEEQDVKHMLRNILEIANHRSDLVIAAEKIFTQLTVDFAIILIAYRPEIMTKEIVSLFISVWQTAEFNVLGVNNPLERMLCSRNVLLLCQADTTITTKVWDRFSDFIATLLTQELLSPEQLEVQCVALFRHTWPPMVLKLIGNCLKSTLEKVKNEACCCNEPTVMLMLEWINETMEDLVI